MCEHHESPGDECCNTRGRRLLGVRASQRQRRPALVPRRARRGFRCCRRSRQRAWLHAVRVDAALRRRRHRTSGVGHQRHAAHRRPRPSAAAPIPTTELPRTKSRREMPLALAGALADSVGPTARADPSTRAVAVFRPPATGLSSDPTSFLTPVIAGVILTVDFAASQGRAGTVAEVRSCACSTRLVQDTRALTRRTATSLLILGTGSAVPLELQGTAIAAWDVFAKPARSTTPSR